MNALILSGGGAKGAFTAGAVTHMIRNENMSFDLSIGTSTGALVGGPALLGDWTYLRDVYVGVNNSDILKNTLLGKIFSLFVKGSVPLNANLKPLRKLLKDYYIKDKNLEKLNNQGKNLIVATVSVKTGTVKYVSSKQVPNKISAETFLDAVLASCAQPVFMRPIQIFANENGHKQQKELFYDGGVKEFLPMAEAVRLKAKTIWAISTHPLKFNETNWGGQGNPGKVSLFKALGWAISSALNEVERGDLFRALAFYRLGRARKQINKIATDNNLNAATLNSLLKVIDDFFETIPDLVEHLHVIYPSRKMSASLEFDPNVMLAFFDDGKKDAKKFFKTPGGPPEFVADGGFVLDM
jgi:predicted patatin/cPLA2 family phospholipase